MRKAWICASLTRSSRANGRCAWNSYSAALSTAMRMITSSLRCGGRLHFCRIAVRNVSQPSAAGGLCSSMR